MSLFDEELKQIVEKHKESADEDLLGFWHLVFSERHNRYREHIEEYFAKISEDDRKKIKRGILTDNKGFYEAINEIFVGGILADFGYSLQYEPKITYGENKFKTPDWLVKRPDGTDLMIDVFTSKTPFYMSKQSEVIGKLTEQIKQIESGYDLFSQIEDAYLVSRSLSEIVNEVSEWLTTQPDINSTIVSNGATFEVSLICEKRHRTTVISRVDDSKRNDLRDLSNKIIKKVSDYEGLSKTLEVPFIVAIVLDRMNIDENTIRQIITTSGHGLMQIRRFKDEGGNTFEKNFVPDGNNGWMELEPRFEEGVFRKDYLSAVLTVWFESRVLSNILTFTNAKATFPISGDTFKV